MRQTDRYTARQRQAHSDSPAERRVEFTDDNTGTAVEDKQADGLDTQKQQRSLQEDRLRQTHSQTGTQIQ